MWGIVAGLWAAYVVLRAWDWVSRWVWFYATRRSHLSSAALTKEFDDAYANYFPPPPSGTG